MEDPFADVHDLEQQHIDDGRAEGVRAGRALGLEEGRELGVHKGCEIGAEVGFYRGCCAAWRAVLRADAHALPHGSERVIAALEHLCDGVRLGDPQDERLHDALESVRGRFKAAATRFGGLHRYVTDGAAPSLAF